MVYFILDPTGFVKIGYSLSPKQRLDALQTSNPRPLTLLGVMPGDLTTERQLHSRFKRLHEMNEWFRADDELLEFISAVASSAGSDKAAPPMDKDGRIPIGARMAMLVMQLIEAGFRPEDIARRFNRSTKWVSRKYSEAIDYPDEVKVLEIEAV